MFCLSRADPNLRSEDATVVVAISSGKELDIGRVARGTGKVAIRRHELSLEGLGESYEGCVIGGQSVSELPNPPDEGRMGVARQPDQSEVRKNAFRAFDRDLVLANQSAKGVDELDVDKMRSVKRALTYQTLSQQGIRSGSAQDVQDR